MAQDSKMAFLTGSMVKTVEDVVVVILSLQAFYEVFVFTIRVVFPELFFFFFLPLSSILSQLYICPQAKNYLLLKMNYCRCV